MPAPYSGGAPKVFRCKGWHVQEETSSCTTHHHQQRTCGASCNPCQVSIYIHSEFRRYVPFTYCVICLREFWSRERCLNHVKKSKVCKFNLLMQEPLLSQEQADSLDQECSARNGQLHAAGRRRHATDLSAIRLQGPLLPILLSESMVSPHHPLGGGQRHC